ncbi:hypothetical protein SCG7086_BD_00160, partial [Chlamydiales bacterium SCGC AG-110-P3]
MKATKTSLFSSIAIFVAIGAATLSYGITPLAEIISDLSDRCSGRGNTWNPLFHERLPRLLVLLLTGASLAVAGAVMQALFQNPLASPGILGITSGGSLVVVILLVTGW